MTTYTIELTYNEMNALRMASQKKMEFYVKSLTRDIAVGVDCRVWYKGIRQLANAWTVLENAVSS